MSTETEEKTEILEAEEVKPEIDVIIDDDTEGTPEPDENTGEEETVKAEEKQINQEEVNKAINKKHRLMREAQEKAEKIQAEKDELQAKLDEINKQEPPVVPDQPDPYDPNYNQLMVERDLAIQKQAQYDVNQQNVVKTQQNTLNEQNARKLQETVDNVNAYGVRTKELGLDEALQAEASNVVGSYIHNQDVKDFLLQDKNGPLMVKYLSENALELETVAGMSTMAAAVHLSTVVSAEATKLKPKITKTPAPIDIPGGRSNPKVNDPFLDGVQME